MRSGGYPGWRQSQHNIRKIKKLFRKVQKMKRSTSKNPVKQAARQALIETAYQAYLEVVESFVQKVRGTVILLQDGELARKEELEKLFRFIEHAERQIDQIRRRVLEKQVIPHDEKVFSVFEGHTEWICKGKAGGAAKGSPPVPDVPSNIAILGGAVLDSGMASCRMVMVSPARAAACDNGALPAPNGAGPIRPSWGVEAIIAWPVLATVTGTA